MKTAEVLIITKNREQFLIKCLDSLVNQSVKPMKVIVVENSQHFGLQKTKERFKNLLNISFYNEKSSHLADLRNLALSKSSGEIILFTDDDCVPGKNWIKNAINTFEENPHIVCLVGRNLCYQKSRFFAQLEQKIYDRWLSLFLDLESSAQIYSGVFFDTKNVAMKKSFLNRHNIFFSRESSFKSEDTEFGLHLFSELKKNEECWFSCNMMIFHNNNDSFIKFAKKRLLEGKEKHFLEKKYPKYEKQLELRSNKESRQIYSFFDKFFFFLANRLQRIGYIQARLVNH